MLINHRILLGSVAFILVLLGVLYFGLQNNQESEKVISGIPELEIQQNDSVSEITVTEEGNEVSSEAVRSMNESSTEDRQIEEDDISVTPQIEASLPTPVVSLPPTPLPVPAPLPTVSGYTAAEVALHGDGESCWTIIRESVYDLTAFIKKHPGGARNILNICGKDGTGAFMTQHGGAEFPETTLAELRIGDFLK